MPQARIAGEARARAWEGEGRNEAPKPILMIDAHMALMKSYIEIEKEHPCPEGKDWLASAQTFVDGLPAAMEFAFNEVERRSQSQKP